MSIYLGTAEINSLKLGTADVSRVMLGNAEVWSAVDPDAADYFARIVSAGSSISVDNKAAVDAFVRGCKADGIWTAIKASCLLAGPDDLTGALVPLVGAAPTNTGLLSADYNRTTGLLKSASGARINSNRANNSDPINSSHLACWVTDTGTGTSVGIMSSSSTLATQKRIWRTTISHNEAAASTYTITTGLVGINRESSTEYTRRVGGVTTPLFRASTGDDSSDIAIFARNTSGTTGWGGRMSFYSIGESLDLALLDARLATYMSSLT
jgi:hypothetical protein